VVHPLLDAAASFLLGAACPGCSAPSAGLCATCAAELGTPALLTPDAAPGLPVVAAAGYDGTWRRALVAYKERQAWGLARPLGAALALAVAEVLRSSGVRAASVLLVPMPSQPRSVRERGQDTTQLLARTAAHRLRDAGLDARVEVCLAHARRVDDQSTLTEAGRRANLSGALVARPRGDACRVVVDDLTTTGASLAEASRALAAAGHPADAAAVVAATRRRDGRVGKNPTRPS